MSQIAIDFLLGPDWLSRIIAWYGEGAGGYSHAASLLEDGTYLDSRIDTIAGVPPGVQVRSPETEKWVKRRRATMEVAPEVYERWETHLRSHLKDRYDRPAIWGFILGRDMHGAGMWDCSALAVDALQFLGIIPTLPFSTHEITPDGLLLVVATAGFALGPEEMPC